MAQWDIRAPMEHEQNLFSAIDMIRDFDKDFPANLQLTIKCFYSEGQWCVEAHENSLGHIYDYADDLCVALKSLKKGVEFAIHG